MALSTHHLDKILNEEAVTRQHFIGTFPECLILTIPPPERRIYSFITNTKNHEDGGEHWNAWFVRGKKLYFFDTFGRAPNDVTFPHSYKDFLFKFGRVYYSKKHIQPFNTFTCGYYCIHFLFTFSLGLDFNHFLLDYSNELSKNDVIVLNIIKSIL